MEKLTIVILGKQGAGKSVLAHEIEKMLSVHPLYVDREVANLDGEIAPIVSDITIKTIQIQGELMLSYGNGCFPADWKHRYIHTEKGDFPDSEPGRKMYERTSDRIPVMSEFFIDTSSLAKYPISPETVHEPYLTNPAKFSADYTLDYYSTAGREREQTIKYLNKIVALWFTSKGTDKHLIVAKRLNEINAPVFPQ